MQPLSQIRNMIRQAASVEEVDAMFAAIQGYSLMDEEAAWGGTLSLDQIKRDALLITAPFVPS